MNGRSAEKEERGEIFLVTVGYAHRLELERRWADYQREPGIALSEAQFWNKVQARKG
jgi:hypothetical protein